MPTLMADHDIEGQFAELVRILLSPDWSELPSSSPRCTAGISPASASDNLPLPDEPTPLRVAANQSV